MFRENTTLAQGLLIAVFSIIVVFLVLLIISYLIDLVALVVKKFFNKNKVNTNAPSKKSAQSDEEIVAVITAAIAAYTGNDNFEVKSVKESGNSSAWLGASKINLVN